MCLAALESLWFLVSPAMKPGAHPPSHRVPWSPRKTEKRLLAKSRASFSCYGLDFGTESPDTQFQSGLSARPLRSLTGSFPEALREKGGAPSSGNGRGTLSSNLSPRGKPLNSGPLLTGLLETPLPWDSSAGTKHLYFWGL